MTNPRQSAPYPTPGVLVACVLCGATKTVPAAQADAAVHRHCPRNGYPGQRRKPYPPRMRPAPPEEAQP